MRAFPISATRSACAVIAGLALGAVALSAQGGGRQQPVPPTASGNQPQIVVGGLQIAKVTSPKDDVFAQPFHSDNGTKLLLWIKMPAGQGLIEIDERASVIAHFGDDKGTDLGGRFGSFPAEFKDGTGGTIEVTSNALPAAGATRLSAEGTIAMSTASGSKPQRVANVRIENGRTFLLDKTTVTVAEVEASGSEQKFTMKLPRSVMEGIKEVRFIDPKGAPLEGHRTSTGYMGDAGEMGVSVTTTSKTVTVEFDVWQGRRVIKVPFKVQAGVGLGG